MKKMILIMSTVVCFGIATESQADDENRCINVHGNYSTCIDKLSDENGNNSCGSNCTFRVIEENGKQVLHIYKVDVSKPATIRVGAFSPNYYKGGKVLDANGNPLSLNNIMLDNDFEYSPLDAFAGSNAQISSANGKFVFNNGQLYFATSRRPALNKATLNGNVLFINSVQETVGNTRINGDVIISDNVKSINEWSFESTEINGNLVIPDTIKSVGQLAFRNLSISGQIYCASGVEACYNMIKTGCDKDNSCLTSLENLLNSKKFSAYPDGREKLEANLKCKKCKSASFKLEDDGWCLRKIYTPAEAAEILTDDNNNSVTITFRK